MEEIKTRLLTNREREMLHEESISNMLPVQFPNGTIFNEFVGCCAKCGKDISSRHLRGKVVMQLDTLARIEAVGVCKECKLVTSFNVRIRDNLAMEYIGQAGHWLRSFPDGHVEFMDTPIRRTKRLFADRIKEFSVHSFAIFTIFLPVIIWVVWMCQRHG